MTTTTEEEVEAQWYIALYEEDCLQIRKLLTEHPRLLKVGWESEPSRQVEGCWPNHFSPPSRSVWKGRTALHVGARRGCVDLINQVLVDLCNLKGPSLQYSIGLEVDDTSVIKAFSSEQKWRLSHYEGNVPLRRISSLGIVESGRGQRVRKPGPRPPPLAEDAAEVPSLRHGVVAEADAAPNGMEIEVAERSSSNDTSGASSRTDESSLESDGDRMTGLAQSTVAYWHQQVEGRKSLARRAFAVWKHTRAQDDKQPAIVKPPPDLGKGHLDEDFSRGASGPLERLLTSKDGEYGLDALAMAAVQGNHTVFNLLTSAISECETPPYRVSKKKLLSRKAWNPGESALRAGLRAATHEVMASFQDDLTFAEYERHRDFNFLPREEYIFHFLYTNHFYNKVQHKPGVEFPAALWSRARWFPSPLWSFLLTLEDGQGRTLLHVAADEKTAIDLLADLKMRIDQNLHVPVAVESAMRARDAAGRTAWHKVVASSQQDVLHELLWFADTRGHSSSSDGESLGLLASKTSALSINADLLSQRNGFGGHRVWNHIDKLVGDYVESIVESSPVHSAIILRNTLYLEDLCNRRAPEILLSNEKRFSWVLEGVEVGNVRVDLDTMELATLMGDLRVVKLFLENGYQRTAKKFTKEDHMGEGSIWYHPWQALHLAAASGSYEMLKMFLDDPLCDPFTDDYEGNTALHHALKVTKLEFDTHLLDYTSCKHILDMRKVTEEASKHQRHADFERQSCINLLLQSGCDIFKANKHMQVPYPRGSLSTNNEFLSWWNAKQTKEFGEIQNTLNIAANAISVTAALVATTSFIGPLQPPLGYNNDGHSNQVQHDNHWVRVFIFCDTISFYLAITAITLSLIPCLPMPQQPMMDELRRTRRMVTLAVTILFPSIICVLIAFGASSIAVISYGRISTSQILMIVATILSAPFFLGGFFLFLVRLLGIFFPSNSYIRYIYNATAC